MRREGGTHLVRCSSTFSTLSNLRLFNTLPELQSRATCSTKSSIPDEKHEHLHTESTKRLGKIVMLERTGSDKWVRSAESVPRSEDCRSFWRRANLEGSHALLKRMYSLQESVATGGALTKIEQSSTSLMHLRPTLSDTAAPEASAFSCTNRSKLPLVLPRNRTSQKRFPTRR